MPNWGGVNQRAVSAKQAKEAARKDKLIQEQKKKEDLLWKDSVTDAKLSKKDELLAKQQEKLQRKLENRRLADEEANQVSTNKKAAKAPPKLTRAEIQQRALLASLKNVTISQPESLPLENPNLVLAREKERAAAEGVELVSATSVSEFLQATSSSNTVDRFSEKRLKAAYAAYEEHWMAVYKVEFPTLKRSQIKEKIWKQWLKAPENPINQAASAA